MSEKEEKRENKEGKEEKYLSTEDFELINTATKQLQDAQYEAKIAELNLERLNLQRKNIILGMYVKYDLSEDDGIDNATGKILKKEDKEDDDQENDQKESN